MIKIILFCATGVTTNMLIRKMEEAAKAKNVEVSVKSYPEAQIERVLVDADVVLVGPQIRHSLETIAIHCQAMKIPVEMISPKDFSLMNGDRVLEQALRMHAHG